MRLLRAALLSLLVLLVPSSSAAARVGWSWPVRGTVITAYRNAASPYASGQHRGIDIAAPVGTPAVSATAGSVRFVGRVGWSGLVVSIRTADGRYDTSYLHLSTIAVRRGQAVLRGQRVGAVGTTGRRSARQPHLHFGVRDAGTRRYHDPLEFLPPLAGPREEPARPRGGPVPVPADPRPRPAPDRVVRPARRPVRVPAGRRLPLPDGRRLPLPVGRRLPLPAGGPRRLPVPGRHALPDLGPAPHGTPVTSRPRAAARARERGGEPRAEPRARPGPDVGLGLACLGLLLAAASAVTALTDAGRTRAARARARAARARARVVAALRPLPRGG
jgi:Peptidase family M23